MFDTEPTEEKYDFIFADAGLPELLELNSRHGLSERVAGSQSDLEKVTRITTWVHGLWHHDGDNETTSPDALTILEEAEAGANFRCVEYGTVLAACTAALGLPSRILQIKTEDSETREYGAGHVVTEVFLRDLRRWVLADGQWNSVPVSREQPLSALELRLALDESLPFSSATRVPASHLHAFSAWIDEYLYFFTTKLDNRDPGTWEGEKLTLGPIGAKAPEVFQRHHPLPDTRYTTSARAFYPQP